jgi:hypothetical protein
MSASRTDSPLARPHGRAPRPFIRPIPEGQAAALKSLPLAKSGDCFLHPLDWYKR